MRSDSMGSGADLRQLCGQFEELLLTAIVPQSLFTVDTLGTGNTLGQSDSSSALSSGVTSEVFRQTFAAAVERGGGLGLGSELARLLGGDTA